MWGFEKWLLQRSSQVLLALTTPTSALYMENLAGAAKGKVKAAEREAEKKKKEKEDKSKEKKILPETKSSSSDSNSEPASPAQ